MEAAPRTTKSTRRIRMVRSLPGAESVTAGSGLARSGPDVDVRLGCVPVDLRELLSREVEPVESRDVRLQLLDARGADQRRGDPRIAKCPGDRKLRQRLAAPRSDLVQRSDLRQ